MMIRPFKSPTPALILGMLAAGSALIYLISLVLPYSLLEYWTRQHVSLASMIGLGIGPDVAYVLNLSMLFALYLIALLIVRPVSHRRMWLIVIAGAVIFNLILLFMYPYEAIDIFDYILRGRMQIIYHANPFYVFPSQFPADPFYPYALWVHSTSAYGPLWEMLAAGLTRLAGENVILNVIAFKLAASAGYALTTALIGWTLRRHSPALALFGVTLFAWNPLVLISTAGNGHNDSLMVACMALGFALLSEKRTTLAVLAQTAGALIKYFPALFVPVILIAGLKAQPDWPGRLRFLIVTGLACLALVLGAYLPYWQGGDILALNRRESMFTTSIPMLIRFGLGQWIGMEAAAKIVAFSALAITLSWVVWQMWRSWRDASPDAAPRASLLIILFYLLITCLWFQPWYGIWALALAPLVLEERLIKGTLLLSIMAEAKLPLFYLLVYRPPYLLKTPFTDLATWLPTLGVCGVYFALPALRRMVARMRAARIHADGIRLA
jgi:hypothetical protein